MPTLRGDLASAIIVNPHFVQLNVPDGGFGSALDAMVQFCLEHGEEFRIGCFRQIDQGDCIVFCFRDSKNAAEFAKLFGGKLFAVPSHDDLFVP